MKKLIPLLIILFATNFAKSQACNCGVDVCDTIGWINVAPSKQQFCDSVFAAWAMALRVNPIEGGIIRGDASGNMRWYDPNLLSWDLHGNNNDLLDKYIGTYTGEGLLIQSIDSFNGATTNAQKTSLNLSVGGLFNTGKSYALVNDSINNFRVGALYDSAGIALFQSTYNFSAFGAIKVNADSIQLLNYNKTVIPVGNVGIGTSAPDAKLHVEGAVKIVDGNQFSGYVLTCDGDGLGSWQAGGISATYNGLTLMGDTVKLGGVLTEPETGVSYGANLLAFVDDFDDPTAGVIFNGTNIGSIDFISPDTISFTAAKVRMAITNNLSVTVVGDVSYNIAGLLRLTSPDIQLATIRGDNNIIFSSFIENSILKSFAYSQRNKWRQSGFHANVDTTTGEGYSNIYFGGLDNSNIITDWARFSAGINDGVLNSHSATVMDTFGTDRITGFISTPTYSELFRGKRGITSSDSIGDILRVDSVGLLFIVDGDTLHKVSRTGQVTINDGTHGAGKVATSDASGNVTWKQKGEDIPSYPDNATAYAAIGGNKFYYTDVAGEWIVKITHP